MFPRLFALLLGFCLGICAVTQAFAQSPEEAQADRIARETCQTLVPSLADAPDSIGDLEERQLLQLALARHYRRYKNTPGAKELETKVRDAALKTTLELMDEAQEKRTGETKYLSSTMSRFTVELGRLPKADSERYAKALQDKMEEIAFLHQISPELMRMASVAKLPFLDQPRPTNNFYTTTAFRAANGGISREQAMEVANKLSTKLGILFSGRPQPTNTTFKVSSQDLVTLQKDFGLENGRLGELAEGLAHSILKNPAQPRPQAPAGFGQGMGYMGFPPFQDQLTLAHLAQILRHPDETGQVRQDWLQLASALETEAQRVAAATEQATAKALAPFKPKGSPKHQQEQVALSYEIQKLDELLETNPEFYSNQTYELAMRLDNEESFGARDTALRTLGVRLAVLDRPESASWILGQVRDQDSAAYGRMNVAEAFLRKGERENAKSQLFLAENSLVSGGMDDAFSWNRILNLMMELDPQLAWSNTLPRMISLMNEERNRKELGVFNRREYRLGGRLGGEDATDFAGVFRTLARRDPAGNPRFAGDRALLAAASFGDATMRTLAQAEVCSIVFGLKQQVLGSWSNPFEGIGTEAASEAK